MLNLFLIPGEYPNLCRGVLTLKIEGKEYKFGHDSRNFLWDPGRYNDDNFDEFWCSGGGLDGDYNPIKEEWQIDVNKIPEQFRKYALEIDREFNENVKYGCCGGCS